MCRGTAERRRRGLRARSSATACASGAAAMSHAFHSPLIEPVLAAFERAQPRSRASPSRASPLVSNVTGAPGRARRDRRAAYWRAPPARAGALRRRRIARAARRRASRTSSRSARTRCCSRMGAAVRARRTATWLPSLRRDEDDWTAIAREPAARCTRAGADVDWAGFDAALPRRRVALPTYPFQRARYWVDCRAARPGAPPTPAAACGTRVATARRRQIGRRARSTSTLGVAIRRKWACLDAADRAPTPRRRCASWAASRAAGERHTLDDAARALAPSAPRVRHLLCALARAPGRRAACCAREGDAFVADGAAARPRAGRRCCGRGRAALADNRPLLRLRASAAARGWPRCCPARESPLETLFPGGSSRLAETSTSARPSCATSTASPPRPSRRWRRAQPADRPLRVLEVGAGTGGTTRGAAARAARRTARVYRFTDVSDFFLERARAQASRPTRSSSTALLDLERDPAEQGYAPAASTSSSPPTSLHATRDLRARSRTLRALLAPGGLLVLVRGDRPTSPGSTSPPG